jgi:hypothetical protein
VRGAPERRQVIHGIERGCHVAAPCHWKCAGRLHGLVERDADRGRLFGGYVNIGKGRRGAYISGIEGAIVVNVEIGDDHVSAFARSSIGILVGIAEIERVS